MKDEERGDDLTISSTRVPRDEWLPGQHRRLIVDEFQNTPTCHDGLPFPLCATLQSVSSRLLVRLVATARIGTPKLVHIVTDDMDKRQTTTKAQRATGEGDGLSPASSCRTISAGSSDPNQPGSARAGVTPFQAESNQLVLAHHSHSGWVQMRLDANSKQSCRHCSESLGPSSVTFTFVFYSHLRCPTSRFSRTASRLPSVLTSG